jgi:16S rRNA G966 N2-methylase RsmD
VKPEHITNGEERYMSTIGDAQNTMSVIKGYVKESVENMSIADAFACLGGNTYFFAETFREVDAYEIDTTRREHLRENIAEYYKRNNVYVHADCGVGEHNIFETYHDVVFLDPPWLNPQTKDVDDFVFEEVQKICARLADNTTTKYVFVKLPLRRDHASSFETLEQDMTGKWIDIATPIITRRKGPTYTILCARLKALAVDSESTDDTIHDNSITGTSVKDLLIRLRDFM